MVWIGFADVRVLDDKMLILFWIPILFCECRSFFDCEVYPLADVRIVSLLYGLYTGMQELFHFLRTAIPLKTGIRA
jgi:hypothetical protein